MAKAEYEDNGRLRLVLDTEEVIPHDPGAGQPALVYVNVSPRGQVFSSTYWYAIGERETVDGIPLTDDEVEWLESLEGKVEAFLNAKTSEVK